MSDMEDSSRTTFEEDFFKFTSESKELFLNNVTFQLGQFVKNGFLKLLFDKAKLLVDMFGNDMGAANDELFSSTNDKQVANQSTKAKPDVKTSAQKSQKGKKSSRPGVNYIVIRYKEVEGELMLWGKPI
uniref:Uncharacterized protein n=1 Tax=Rhizophagus irregularis (strain DAOM 181602 / DAOM 197198 / MUCL 43194) TaxID=747089 RepID=U9UA41_RHIID